MVNFIPYDKRRPFNNAYENMFRAYGLKHDFNSVSIYTKIYKIVAEINGGFRNG